MSDSPQWSTRTFGNEDLLPRVPLPTLDATCARFIEWCSPLLTPEQLAETEAALAEFRAGPGPVLQAALAEYDALPDTRSWLDTFWPRRYLGRRDRIALNANFVFLFKDGPGDYGKGQLDRAAGLIAAALAYKAKLDREEIPPIVQRGQALSMAQNRFLFSETRIPGAVQDTVRVPYSDDWPGPSRARHIVVMVGGNAFWLEVLSSDGTPYTVDELAAGLRAVRGAGAVRAAADTSIGHLTTKARAAWAQSRANLIALDPANAAGIETIETALFLVCLEDKVPADSLDACDHLLHGDSANRYFDKALSFIVFADGTAGINVEHCGLDGTTILSFIDTLLGASAQEHSANSGARSQGTPASAAVPFVLDAALRADIAEAAASFRQFADDTASTVVSFPDFGTDRAKALKTSPDAFAQLAFQLAHQRAKGFVGATYESIATRQWRAGRTEAMRVVTPEVLAFVAAMQDPAADAESRRAALRAAAGKHVERAKQCQAGDAPEQHLWELLLIQHRRGAQLGVPDPPALYSTPGWLVMRDDYLSTSSAPSVNIEYFGFGSTSSHCIGVAYLLLPDRFNLYLSTPRPVADGMYRFGDEMRVAVAELQDLLAE